MTNLIENQVFFSPGEQCRQAISHFIQNAFKTLYICVFTISDDHISREILTAYHKGVQIKIITDDDKSLDKGSDIDYLASSGILVKTDKTADHMHHKFAVRDGKEFLSGSYNWTRSAALYNHENIIIGNHPETVKAFEKEFERLWKIF
jgi:mitochondrial cardiolipin hydrolase